MTSEWDHEYKVVHALVLKCGEIIANAISKSKAVLTKSCEVDLVTVTDKEVEQILIGGLSHEFPDHRFIGEESVADGGKCELTDSPTWIIDPVDGTMNFVHTFPHCCISIALYVNQIPEIGIIYNPVLKQLFTARKGQGAFLNGEQIHVSKETKMSKALVMAEAGTSRDPENMRVVLANYQAIIPRVHGVRTLGSAALNMAMVAYGGADANYEIGIHAWDIAAGALLVREAGGVCIDPAGKDLDILDRRVLCASAMELAQEVASVLVQFYPPRD